MCIRRRNPGGGFTLVELLVAMGLTSLVAVALLAAAQVQSRLQRQEQQAQQAQDNVRSSIEELVNSLRQAGTPFSYMANNGVNAVSSAQLYSVTVANSSTGPDALQVLVADNSALSTVLQPILPGTAPLVVDTAGTLNNGSFVFVTDFINATLYRLNAAPTAVAYGATTAVGLPVLPAGGITNSFLPGAAALLARPISYQVNTTMFTDIPVLTLQDGAPFDTTQPEQIVAEDIVDLQVAVGVDGLHSGIPDGSLQEIGAGADDDEWVYNFPGEVMPYPLPPGSRIAAVRVSVVARTSQIYDELGAGRPAVEDHTAGLPDLYRWRVLTAVVSLRSLATN